MAKRKLDVTELVNQFAEGVAAQTDAIWAGDARTGNKHGKRYNLAFQKLRSIGNPGRDALATLFNHPRPDVCVMTAVYLLRHRTNEALAVLRAEAARGPSPGLYP